MTLARPLVDAVRALDPTRPVTAALASLAMSDAVGLPALLDIVGYNYQETRYAADHARYPGRVIFGSENSHQFGNWAIVRDNAYVAGQFLWTGIDYLGEAGVVSQPRQRRRAARPVRVQETDGLVPAEPVERRPDGVPGSGGRADPATAPAGTVPPRHVAGHGSRNTGTGRPVRRSRSRATRTARRSRSRSTISRSASSRSPAPLTACCAGTCRINPAFSRLWGA